MVSIKYDGSVIETIEGGQTITLHTNGMKAKTDIIINVTTGRLISFTIDGETYQAEEGMTWEEWVNTDFNTDGYRVYEKIDAVNPENCGIYIVIDSNNYLSAFGVVVYKASTILEVHPHDLIIASYEYILRDGGFL